MTILRPELSGCLPLAALRGTPGTKSGEFEIVSDNLIDRRAVEIIFEFIERCNGRIVNAVAADTADVVVLLGNAVVALHGAGELQALDFTQFAEYIEVPVYGAQTNAGQSFAHPFVYFIGRRMVVDLADLFQNNPSLPRHSCLFVEFHAHDLHEKV